MEVNDWQDEITDWQDDPTDFVDVKKPGTSRGRTTLEQSLQGATFGLSDEITDRIGALIASKYTGLPYGDLLSEARTASKTRLEDQAEEHPTNTLLSNLAGAILTGGAGATTKVGTKAANLLRSGNVAARTGKSAIAGASSGALYGAGTSEDRIEGAIEGGITGGIAGGAVPVVGAALRKGVSKLSGNIAERGTRRIAEESGEVVDPELSKDIDKIYKRLRKDYPDDVEFRKALNSYLSSQDKALLEAGGKRTTNLAEGAAQYPSGGAAASEFFDESVGKAPEKLKKTLEKTISPEVNYYDTLDDVVSAGREKAKPVYQEAYKANQSVDSPVINKILETPEGKSALQEAVRNVQNEMARVAKPDKELTELASEIFGIDGGVAKGLKLRTLDEIKKAMDGTINKAYRAGDEAEGRRIVNLKNSLVSEIDSQDKSGLYAKARKTSGDYLSNRDAMDAGLGFLREDAEVVKRTLKEYGPSEKQAYRVGVLKSLRNDIDGKYDGRNVAQLFQKPATREKLQSILSKQEYNKLMADAKATDNIFKLRNQITGNSRTALRQMARQEFDDETQQFIEETARQGWKAATAKKVISVIRNKFDGMNDKLAKEVSDILYETDPKKKFQIVKQLTNQANTEGVNLKKTQAAQKLAVFYAISDKVAEAKIGIAPAIAGAKAGMETGEQPSRRNALKVTISPDLSKRN